MIWRVAKEVFLCLLVGSLNVVFTAVLGVIGLPKYFLWKMLIWIATGLLSYLLIVPWYNFKEKRFVDFAPLGFAFIIVAVFSLAGVEDPNDSGYFQLFIVFSSIPFLGGWFKSIKDSIGIEAVLKSNKALLENFENDEKPDVLKIVESFYKKKEFNVLEASKVVSVSENKTRKLLRKMQDNNIVESYKKGNSTSYKIKRNK